MQHLRKHFWAFILGGIGSWLAWAGGNQAQPIFDGKSLHGWVTRGGKANYVVEDGCIVGKTVLDTGNSFLCTEKEYGDFVLELDFKVDPKLNSGVQIRSECFPKATSVIVGEKKIEIPAGRVHGYQVEIDPSKRAWTGGLYDEGRRAWLQNLEKNPAAQAAFKQGEWNHFKIEARGPSLKTWLNGVPATDFQDSMTLKGFIGLQVHSSKEANLEVRWKNLQLEELK